VRAQAEAAAAAAVGQAPPSIGHSNDSATSSKAPPAAQLDAPARPSLAPVATLPPSHSHSGPGADLPTPPQLDDEGGRRAGPQSQGSDTRGQGMGSALAVGAGVGEGIRKSARASDLAWALAGFAVVLVAATGA
jgi:hypothetical protein